MKDILIKCRKIISNKYFFLVLIAIFTVPFILNITIFQFTTPITYHGDWLSFWGNYSGGILSAIVAYLVANFQIRKQFKKDKFERIINQLPSLLRIKIELEKYQDELLKVKEQRETTIKKRGGITKKPGEYKTLTDFFESQEEGIPEFEITEKHYYMELPQPDSSRYLEKVEDVDLHIELITCFNFYKDFSDAMNFKMSLADKIRENLDASIFELLENGEINVSDFQVLTEKTGIMFVETNKYYDKKKRCWKEFYDENMLRKFNDVLTHLNSEIENVKEIKRKGYSVYL
jgi:hypothetical protein